MIESDTRTAWSKLANFYREFREIDGKFNDRDMARIGEYPYMFLLMEQTQMMGKSVLDVGCGYGFYSFISEKMGAINIEGIDFSPEMIKLALEYKAKKGSEVNFSVARIEELPFAKNSFDVITSGMAIDVENLSQAFSELCRVLKNKGSVIFSIPHPVSTHGRFNESGNFELEEYFSSRSYISMWYTENGNPVTFRRPNKTIEDYIEALYKNNFVLLRLFESRPIYKAEDATAAKLGIRMVNIPTYLIILAKKAEFI